VWFGLLDDFVIGPHVLSNRLMGEACLDFFINTLPQLLEEVTLRLRQSMWYMHDGAPAHFGIQVSNHLNDPYPGRWIGRGSPVAWPARSPDLNPLDIFHLGTPQDLRVRDLLFKQKQTSCSQPGCMRRHPTYTWHLRTHQTVNAEVVHVVFTDGGRHIKQLL
jgi:hypothetical protein